METLYNIAQQKPYKLPESSEINTIQMPIGSVQYKQGPPIRTSLAVNK